MTDWMVMYLALLSIETSHDDQKSWLPIFCWLAGSTFPTECDAGLGLYAITLCFPCLLEKP